MEKSYAETVPACVVTSISDNQTYPQACLQATMDYACFNSFRRNEAYCEILEHVPPEQGREYLEIIGSSPEIMADMAEFKRNDAYGSPHTHEYPGIGAVSPTTLRYIKVLLDLKLLFRTLDDLSICEIGVGYGGQCRIVNAHYKPSIYTLVDILPALALARRFLDHYILHSATCYKTMSELEPLDHDLVISNYAFSELSRAVQDVYLDRVIFRSRMGYVTYNEITPAEFNSYTAEELVSIIPNSRIIAEKPLTHPRNCIIVWGGILAQAVGDGLVETVETAAHVAGLHRDEDFQTAGEAQHGGED